MGTVSKSDIIRETAAKSGAHATIVKEVVDAMLETVAGRAEAGDTINLIGFGRFSVKARPARTGRNPATGASIEISESRKLVFKASKKAN